MDPAIAPITPDDEPDAEALLDAAFAGRHQARLGEVIDVLSLPGFVARDRSRIVVTDDQRRTGTGTALVEALRFYQRRDFRLAELHVGAADAARELKPSIPLVGAFRIPIRDELVLVRQLR